MPLSSLFGGSSLPGIGGGTGGSASQAAPFAAPVGLGFGGFNVGGTGNKVGGGTASASAEAGASTGGTPQWLLYVGLGLWALSLVFALIRK